MATQYSLTNAFAAITEESGTIQNIGYESVELVSTSNAVEGEGIILLPGEKKAFKGAIKARSLGATNTVNVVDFKEGVGGGDDVMTGASASADGKAGLVPTPTAGNESRFLRGDGTWAVPTDEDTQYQPATTLTDGLMSAADKTFVEGEKEQYRQPSTAYTAGQIAYHSALGTSKLVCVQAGITSSGTITPSTTEGELTTDGTVVWQTDSLADGNYTAIHQNGIAGGRDITAYWESGILSTNIQSGLFVGMHIGDYITKTVELPAMTYTDKSGTEVTQAAQTFSNVKWLVAAIDPHLHCGDTENTAHHVLLIPSSTLQRNVSMNPTNDTTGAYLGSDMWTKHMPNWATAIKNAFGSTHVLNHREVLPNATNTTVQSTSGGLTGKSSNWAWTSVDVNIPNETMVYGGSVWGSSYDVGDFPRQLPLYALKCSHLDDRSWFWLRAVASSAHFADANVYGDAYYTNAGYSNLLGGIRPYFLLR